MNVAQKFAAAAQPYTQPKYQNQIQRAGGSIMGFLGWAMIFGFTGTCTVLLLRQYAPANVPWLPWFGLAAFEFGVIHWLHKHQHNAKNALQFLLGLGMTIISAFAIAAITGTEMVSWFAQSGLVSMPAWIQAALFIAIIAVIVLNVVAFICWKLFDPRHLAMWLRHDTTALSEDARDYSPASIANNPPEQFYSRTQVEQITGEILAIMEARNTGPLAVPPVQNSTGATKKKNQSAHRAAPGESTQTNK